MLYSAWWWQGVRQTAEEAFLVESRIFHRLLSQRMEQNEALLVALAALEYPVTDKQLQVFAASIKPTYSQVEAVERYQKQADGHWQFFTTGPASPVSEATLNLAARQQNTSLAIVDDPAAYRLLRAPSGNTVFALRIVPQCLLDASEWPPSTMSFSLVAGNKVLWQRPASSREWPALPSLHFEKTLAANSQAFLAETAQTGLGRAVPWGSLLAGVLAAWLLSFGGGWAWGQYRRRALTQRQLDLAQASRVNAMGEVAAGIAHELNQPLMAVLSNVRAVENWLDDDPANIAQARVSAGNAVRQAKRAGKILHHLRHLISPKNEALQPVNLNHVIEEVLSLMADPLDQQQIRVRFQPGALPPVTGHLVALEQVMMNLTLNAIDAMQEAAMRELIIESHCEKTMVVVTVSDSGKGFDNTGRVFEPFFTTKPDGMGLGLGICENIIQQYSGTLQAENRPGGGARLTIRLPASQEGGSHE